MDFKSQYSEDVNLTQPNLQVSAIPFKISIFWASRQADSEMYTEASLVTVNKEHGHLRQTP